MNTTARFLALCILISPLAAVALSSQEVELTIEAGKLGAVGLLGETHSIGFAGNLIDLTATHRKTGFGVEITPFFLTLDTDTRESEISIVNLTFFHRTFDPNGFSIVGPFVSFNLLEPTLDGLLTRAGFRVTWRTPWRYKKRALAPDAAARPLFTICNLEAGAQWRDGPAFFAGVSIDASIPLFSIMKFFVNGARRQAWEVNPEFKNPATMQ
ncbi:MAG TPA: hypothetical protein PLU93_04400 [Treponemataceae bacterium]|nr:hypothetical protein [Treponemataceae bacterium]